MQRNIDDITQARLRRDAWVSALISSAWPVLSAIGILALGYLCFPEGLMRTALLVIALVDLATLIPVWIVLLKRLKEIKGGKRNASA